MMRYSFGICVHHICHHISMCYFCSNNQYHLMFVCAVMHSLINYFISLFFFYFYATFLPDVYPELAL